MNESQHRSEAAEETSRRDSERKRADIYRSFAGHPDPVQDGPEPEPKKDASQEENT